MLVCIGSQNEIKIDAVKEVLRAYAMFDDASFASFPVPADALHQPRNLNETVEGAKARAKAAWKEGCLLSVGIEGGLMEVPYTKTGYMNVEVCVLYDGKQFHIGTSPGFEYPPSVIRRVFDHNEEISTAYRNAGLTSHPKIGMVQGAIGDLTKGRMSRKEYTKLAIQMALIHLENPELY